MNSFSWIEKIGLVLFLYFICSNIINFVKYRRVKLDIDSGNIPDYLKKFPVHSTSPNDYLKSKDKVEKFIISALTEQSAALKLNQDDLNNLYAKGINLNKYSPGTYLYYQIKDNLIFEKIIEGPWYLPPVPYRTRTTEFSFPTKELEQYSRVIEEHEKQIKGELKKFPLSISSLILFILGASDSPDRLPLEFKKTVEYQRGLILLEKIKSIEIDDNHLILRT